MVVFLPVYNLGFWALRITNLIILEPPTPTIEEPKPLETPSPTEEEAKTLEEEKPQAEVPSKEEVKESWEEVADAWDASSEEEMEEEKPTKTGQYICACHGK